MNDRDWAVGMVRQCGSDRAEQQAAQRTSPWLPATIIEASLDASISVGTTLEYTISVRISGDSDSLRLALRVLRA